MAINYPEGACWDKLDAQTCMEGALEIEALRAARAPADSVTAPAGGAVGIYVASRASLPERPAYWRALRAAGWPIVSTWIDEAGPGETADLRELWARIIREISSARGLVLHVETDDFPLKGALIEVGAALSLGKRVGVYAPGVVLEDRSMRPLGSWAAHPLVRLCTTLADAREWAESMSTPPAQAADSVLEDAALTFTSAHIDYVARYGGRCRDCADESGVCPGSGLPCADSRKAIKHVFDALEYGVKHGYIKPPVATRKQGGA
ncbi:hypothetical protein DBR23_02320 [Acidovorax sp. HMWF018]|nr:hypothetical protein DBR23_02320 [Acidovorax sp. HMWF018]